MTPDSDVYRGVHRIYGRAYIYIFYSMQPCVFVSFSPKITQFPKFSLGLREEAVSETQTKRALDSDAPRVVRRL